MSTRTANLLAWVTTGTVITLVILMGSPRKIPLPDGVSLSFLPLVHAVLNSLTALCLVAGFAAVKKRNLARHRRMMTTALILSAIFLLCYVSYHFTTPETKFGGQGWIRPVYFFLLISHISIASISFPLILFTFIAAWTKDIDRHRRLVRYSFPLWLYVAITGPLCYLMLRPYY